MDKSCTKILATASLESELPPVYYTLDEIAHVQRVARHERSYRCNMAKHDKMLQVQPNLIAPDLEQPCACKDTRSL